MTKKISNFMRYFALSLVLMMSLFLTSVFPSEASDVTFNLGSDDVPSGGSGVYANGISASHKSGYLVYIVDQYGNRASPDAKLYRSTALCSFPTGSSVWWDVESRLGGYSVSRADYHSGDIAPWNISPLRIDGGWYSNEAEIRSWMAMPSVGRPELLNVQQFIIDAWSLDLEERWVSEDLILLIEPVYSYQVWYRYSIELDFPSTSVYEDSVTEYNTRYDAPILVGTSKTLAEMTNNFIMSLPSSPVVKANMWATNGPKVTLTYKRSFTASAMASGYARGFCHAEKLATGIGSLPAGVTGNGILSLSQISGTGVGIFAVTARGIMDSVTITTPDDPDPSDYDGTVYTLTATGGSSSSGSGSSATTYFGNGSGSCLSGSLYAENCASGTDAYKSITKEKL